MGGLLLALLVGYIIGGLTFIPLLVWVLWTWNTRRQSDTQAHTTPGLPDREHNANPSDWGAALGEDLLRELKAKHVPDVASGYFAICREYVPGGVNGKPPDRNTPSTGAMSTMESPSVYQSMYRSIFDRSRNTGPTLNPSVSQAKNRKPRNVFYVVLRLGHLMLYDDAEQLEVRHVISLAHYTVSIYAGGEDIPEGELWIKRNCIRLTPRDSENSVDDAKMFYLFSDNCSEKEDFYHAMLQSQESHEKSVLRFNPTDLIKLVQQLHASEENLHTRWINALIGRLFLAMYKTKQIEDYIWTKVTKKIERVQKPSLISSIKVQKLDMGDLPPFLTNPKLKELTMDGDLTVEADVTYKGNFRIDISAVARIELGSRFKPREVTFILATILKGLEGHVLIRIKPPPSNRMWITFETPPKIELSLEPIVSSRQITYGVILRAIESRIREVVNETLVFPNWDDIPFSSTLSHQLRGGIWKDEASPDETLLNKMLKDTSNILSVADAIPDSHESLDTVSSQNAIYSSSHDVVDTSPALAPNTLHKRRSVQPDRTEDESLTPESHEHVDIAALARDTMTYSPPQSPMNPTLVPRTTPSPNERHADSNDPLDISDSDRGADAHTQYMNDLSSLSPIHDSSAYSVSSKRAGQPVDTTHVQRRPTINQSLSSATTAAKKWLTARQNVNTFGAAVGNHTTGNEGSGQVTATHLREPIGRGQPLPPPGTPLPPPNKPDKKGTWSAQTASTLVNFARRNPLGNKSSTVLSDLPTSPRAQDGLADTRDVDNQGFGRSNASIPKSDSPPSTPPPALPKRRQRLSLVEPITSNPREEILIVEAPTQEPSPPSSSIPDGEPSDK